MNKKEFHLTFFCCLIVEEMNHNCKKAFFTSWLEKRRQATSSELNAFILDITDSKINPTQSARRATTWATHFNECGEQINDVWVREDGETVLLHQ